MSACPRCGVSRELHEKTVNTARKPKVHPAPESLVCPLEESDEEGHYRVDWPLVAKRRKKHEKRRRERIATRAVKTAA